MSRIKVAIAGVGNCASNLVQGIEFYRRNKNNTVGLMHRKIGKYDIGDIEIVAAFDIAEGKVGEDLHDSIHAKPNCTEKLVDLEPSGVIVQKGFVLDGWGSHFEGYVKVSQDDECDVEQVLREQEVDVLIIMLPTGSVEACYRYAEIALGMGISIVNGIPVLLSHDEKIINLAKENNAVIVGDDFKSQIGGAILHNTLHRLLEDRGVQINKSYQLNYAGNMDFLNLQTSRGDAKHKSKKRGINAGCDDIDVSINVSYLENQDDNKTCRIWIEGANFANCPVTLECKLTVVDSANSSGVAIDAIRCAAVAKDKGIFGRLDAPSAFYMKSPAIQLENKAAIAEIESLIN